MSIIEPIAGGGDDDGNVGCVIAVCKGGGVWLEFGCDDVADC